MTKTASLFAAIVVFAPLAALALLQAAAIVS
jgi:hypothetical protein